MKKLYEDFKAFAFSGDIIALAVAFVMAAAFGAVVAALVDYIVMPIVGIIFGEPSFDFLTWTINDSIILYGSFITAVVKFLAIALGVFFFIVKPYKAYQEMKKEEEPEEAAAPDERIELLKEIRDALRK
jgi:large conductance mechanosensitive channel